MLNRILTTRLPLLAYHPPKTYDLDFFKTIWLAGAMPVLDTEFIGTSQLSDLLGQLKNQNLRHGIRIYAEDEKIWDYFEQHPADLPECVILACHNPDSLINNRIAVNRLTVSPEILMVEIYEPGLETILKSINPHGIILKGREAGGRTSSASSFMLSQYYAQKIDVPYFVHGGVGFHTAPGFFAAGASGLVLDDQLYLAEDAPVSGPFKKVLEKMEETDTVILDGGGNTQHRVFAKPGTKIVQDLIKKISIKKAEGQDLGFIKTALEQNMASLGQENDAPMQALFYLGQDAAFARHFAKRGSRLTQMIQALFTSVGNALNAVEQFDPLTEHASLAKEHGTRFPITQGPMANISDNKEFAKAVYDNGGLPFFALGSLPLEIANGILPEKSDELPVFGAGMIGIKAFNPTLDHHLDLIKTKQTPFALFAGGIPSQINELEACGTRAYLHTPLPGVLKNAFEKGTRRFILEGNEAGGHIGSLSSTVLWELSIETLLDLPLDQRPNISVLFAGGITSAEGSHFISAMTALLAREGVKIGIQLGTAYLFTKEIIETGALTPVYQTVVREHKCTTIIGSTVGLACRTANTAFAGQIMKNEHCRLAETMTLSLRKSAFEKDNLGSLLISAKGKTPDFGRKNNGQWISYTDEEQRSNGNFMTGEGLAFFENQTTIAEIHHRLFLQKDALIARLNALEVLFSAQGEINDEIAVVGMGCVFPDAHDTDSFWHNILDKKYSICELPDSRWEKSLYYDPDPKAQDKSYTQIAGIVNDFQFDSERFGYTPAKASKLSRSQQMLLHAAYQAVENANLLTDDNRIAAKEQKRTAVIVATCLGNEMASDLHFKYFFPEVKQYLRNTPEFNALSEPEQKKIIDQLRIKMSQGSIYEPVHGVTLNMEAARIAHHLGIFGTNYVVDAACATALSAIECGIHELLSGTHDTVIAGGVNTNLTPESFVGFCKMGTLSANGSFPFDERADGFILGEGAGVLVLKRLKDAIREKDPILGVIKSIASSSDGKGKGIAAPDKEGQKLAFQRCHEKIKSEFSPGMVQFIEAHGTGTKVGDAVEMETLRQVYNQGTSIGVSSIKSQIGHLLGAAGMAGMIKTLLALNHQTLPPNGAFEKISPKIDIADSSLFVLENPRPWDAPANGPRMAAVSAYGFGGINYHTVVSEFNGADTALSRRIFADLDHDPNDDRIVFSGMGVVLPKAKNKDAFWDAMVSGQKAYQPMPSERLANACYAQEDENSGFHLPMMKNGIVDDFLLDPKTFKIPPSAMAYMDRAQLFGLDAAGQALEQAGLLNNLAAGNRIGVILGTISGTRNVESIIRTRIPLLQRMIRSVKEMDENTLSAIADHVGALLCKRYPAMTGDSIPGMLSNIVSARISKHYNTQGTNFVVDASCASATMALDMAVKNLRSGDLDAVVTGGVDTNLYPGVLLAFKRLGILAQTEPSLFDNDANGYVMGEGAACLVVTTYKYAKQNNMPVLGELKCLNLAASAPEHLLSPSENKYESVISNDTGTFKTRKTDLAYLDVFGVSNPFLDLVEKQAIEKSLSHPVAYGNIKTEFGYFKAANPAVVMTRLLMMSGKGVLLPTHGFRPQSTLIEEESLLHPVKEITPLADGALLGADVNGIGGNHAHIIIGRVPRFLQAQNAYASVELPAITPGAWPNQVRTAAVTALLSGQGAQSAGMLNALYQAVPEIKALMDQGEKIFLERRGASLLDIMTTGGAPLNQTENTQPAIFLSTAAIYHALSLKGFEPDFYIGHSVGEYSALYCAGLIDFATAMNLVISRADFMGRASKENPGGIMVVFDGEKGAQAMISDSGVKDIWLVNKNSEKQTAIAGTTQGIDLFCAHLKDKDILHKKLALSAAFHTPLLEPAAGNMAKTLESVKFNLKNAHKIISNLTARPYPADEQMIRVHLARQIVSPVEFVESVKGVHAMGCKRFIEIGPGRLLCNLLKNISIETAESMPTADAKKGELECFTLASDRFITPEAKNTAQASEPAPRELMTIEPQNVKNKSLQKTDAPIEPMNNDMDFNTFIKQNETLVQAALQREYRAFQQKKALADVENLGLYTGFVCIAGAAVGLPGKGNQVFNEKNFDRILAGHNFIEPLTQEEKNKIVDMNITRVFKEPNGNARFLEIVRTSDVIQLAGKLGYFDLSTEYGISRKFDLVDELAMAAGLEALKDAHIPLVNGYKKTSTGSSIPDGLVLPEEMQDTTGVIMTGIFPGFETLLHHLNAYYYNKFYVKPYDELENIYYHLMEHLTDRDMKDVITDWFFRIRERRKVYGQYKFERNILFDIVSLGGAHFAQLIRAKGPNIHLTGACASTTQAIGVAGDWIRTGRCDRVIVIGGEAATSEAQMPWVGSGFLAMGAATSKEVVSDAAKPFDEDRNGTILGSGAVGLVVERQDTLNHRGLNGQARILGSHIGNSAFHPSRIDVNHLAGELNKFVGRVEKQNAISRTDMAGQLVFMSHETFTPARGGSASAEVNALKSAFPNDYKKIAITNTKGYTGHTLGAGIEDAILVKGLQKKTFPPVANLDHVPAEFSDLNFTKSGHGDYRFGLHFSAGFGSHYAFLIMDRVQEAGVENNPAYQAWLARITGSADPKLAIINKTLCVFPGDQRTGPMIQESVKDKGSETAGHEEPKQPVPVRAEQPGKVAGDAAATDVLSQITGLIANQTGYTHDMLEPDLDLEADLGIDTVKQVETFGKITKSFGLTVPEDISLSELNTIRKIASYIGSRISTDQTPEPPASGTIARTPDSGADSGPDITAEITSLIAEQTGYTRDMLEPDLDLEADLGIDTVKQVETFGKITKSFGLTVPEDISLSELNTIRKIAQYISSRIPTDQTPEPPASGTIARTPDSDSGSGPDITAEITSMIAEQTGYTRDMLEPDLDLEADLGIDTVKQVETFGKITKSFGLTVPEDISLSELNTIRKIAQYISSRIQTDQTPEPPASGTIAQTPDSGSGSGPDITGEITSMIAEQTGYTRDMLEPDLDLEADLGIDTVKQVETFGKITKAYGLSVPEDINLSELNTIRKISEYIQTNLPGDSGTTKAKTTPVPATPDSQAPETGQPGQSGIQRYTFGLRQLPGSVPGDLGFEGQTYLITMDKQGFGRTVADLIKENKGHAICVGNSEHDDYTVDLNTLERAEEIIPQIKADHDGISGIFFLHPLDFAMAPGATLNQENAAVKFLFLLCKAFGSHLGQSCRRLAAVSVQSALARFREPAPDQLYPVFSGISGLLKTVAKEYPGTGVKLVEFMDKTELADMARAASLFMNEVFGDSTRLEVGLEKGKRFGIRANTGSPATPQTRDKDFSVIKDNDTLLVTGGAAGITYELLKSVTTAGMTLVILGRSRVEDELEIPGTDATVDKMNDTQIMAALKSIHPTAKPVELKNRTAGLRRILTARENLARLRAQAKAVDYHAVDVTDPGAVQKAVSQYDRIDGVIHAAGVDKSIMIEKKSMDDFNLVFDTKVKGVANVLAAIENKNCRYIIGFSSITARFGNEAQSDYTAGNDMMGAMIQANALKTKYLTFKIFDWTAWAEIGMAAQGTIEAVLKEKGIAFLPVAQGIRFFQEEMHNPDSVEILIGAPPEKNPAAFDPDGLLAIGPFLDTVEQDAARGRLKFKRLLEADRDLFLFDHARKGVPLFLGATGLETMAEAALECSGGQGHILEASDFKIPYGIKLLKNRPKNIEIFAEKTADGLITTQIQSVFTPPGGNAPAQKTLHYQGKFKIGTDLPALDEIAPPALSEFKVDAGWQEQIYHPDRLFMDGLFRSVDQLVSLDQESLVTVVQWRPGREFFKGQTHPEFVTPVVIMDAMFQTGGILEFFTSADVVLPYAISKVSFAGTVLPDTPYFCVTRRLAQGSDTKTYHMQLADLSGRVIIDIQDFQMVRVDRLAEEDRPDAQIIKNSLLAS
ncbi:type I polyketide synthase [Desulfobacter vibrioformis]|uniref:type I polyketide synthase n=1 Tax=Desulfobacter vibrioformis TaxID=34031 RepID=UPI0005559868|nr:type I polyketide synthase [Desulfobacter vibrioformis]